MSHLKISCLAAPKHETVLQITIYLRNNQHCLPQSVPDKKSEAHCPYCYLPLCSRHLGQGKSYNFMLSIITPSMG